MKDEWQPIETAPHFTPNAKPVWVYGGRYKKATLLASDGDFWKREKQLGSKTIPTHWMPHTPPEPPKEEK